LLEWLDYADVGMVLTLLLLLTGSRKRSKGVWKMARARKKRCNLLSDKPPECMEKTTLKI